MRDAKLAFVLLAMDIILLPPPHFHATNKKSGSPATAHFPFSSMQPGWLYTHGKVYLPPSSWGVISVPASSLILQFYLGTWPNGK